MIDYSEAWLLPLVFRMKGSVTYRSCLFAVPSLLLSLFLVSVDDIIPDFRESVGILNLKESQLWTATTVVLGIMLGFRTNRAMARFWEGTGLLHQMRGEWFDSVSCCVTFSLAAQSSKPIEVKKFRHTLVRLMSLCHGSALEEIAGHGGDHDIETVDVYGLDNTTLKHLKNCKDNLNFNRVEVLLHLTQSIITKALDDGVLKIPPPILSRVYQTLSRGFVNLLNAKKIADTRFPFPFAQIITMMLLTQVIVTPVMLSCLISSKVWVSIFTFVSIFGMFYLNFVGVELENPFGMDANDLPLEHFQKDMNNCLLMLLHDKADLIATVDDERCVMDFSELRDSLTSPGEGPSGRCTHEMTGEDKPVLAKSRSHARITTFSVSNKKEDDAKHSICRSSVYTEKSGIAGSVYDRGKSHSIGSALSSTTALRFLEEMLADSADSEKVEAAREAVCIETSVPNAATHMDEQAGKAHFSKVSEGLDAALFHCAVEACPGPIHPTVQTEVPKRTNGDFGVALEVANDLVHEMNVDLASPAPNLQGSWERLEPADRRAIRFEEDQWETREPVAQAGLARS